MLQNRVTPFGEIIRTPARGHWTGNRGVLHDQQQEIRRPFRLKAWIICRLSFKGRHRVVMSPNRWTELFFFDEATAFAAGHRPCFECRREDAVRFKQAWLKGNPTYGFDEKTPIGAIDDILHAQRLSPSRQKETYAEELSTLPNGTFISIKDEAYLVYDNHIYRWSPEGYAAGTAAPEAVPAPEGAVIVLTPRSVVNAFRAGYVPEVRLNFLL